MEQHGVQARRAAEEIWKWRQTHGFASDRSIKVLEEIIERHTAGIKAHDLVAEILKGRTHPSKARWSEICRMAGELSEGLEKDQSKSWDEA